MGDWRIWAAIGQLHKCLCFILASYRELVLHLCRHSGRTQIGATVGIVVIASLVLFWTSSYGSSIH